MKSRKSPQPNTPAQSAPPPPIALNRVQLHDDLDAPPRGVRLRTAQG